MGYRARRGRWLPGVSVLRRTRSGDDFCTAWHFFDLFPNGPAGWRAQFRYPGRL